MKQEDIVHLATLARIKLSEDELQNLGGELSSIMSYVSTISDMAGDSSGDSSPQVGPRHNVFREDVVTNTADQYTADLLAEMPRSEGRYLKVKKILGGTE